MPFLFIEGVLLGHVHVLGHRGRVVVSSLGCLLLGIVSKKNSELSLFALLHNSIFFTPHKHHMLLVF